GGDVGAVHDVTLWNWRYGRLTFASTLLITNVHHLSIRDIANADRIGCCGRNDTAQDDRFHDANGPGDQAGGRARCSPRSPIARSLYRDFNARRLQAAGPAYAGRKVAAEAERAPRTSIASLRTSIASLKRSLLPGSRRPFRPGGL